MTGVYQEMKAADVYNHPFYDCQQIGVELTTEIDKAIGLPDKESPQTS